MFLGMPKVSTMHRCEDTYWVYHPIIKIAEAITRAEEFTQVGGSTQQHVNMALDEEGIAFDVRSDTAANFTSC